MEFLDIVNENDEVIGNAAKEEIYAKKLPHRIVHVFLINDAGKVFLQKRSENKSYLPGHYSTSAAGHVHSGESYQEAATRELLEELGIDGNIEKTAYTYFEVDGQKVFIGIFSVKSNVKITFHEGEVAGGDFFTIQEAKKLIENNKKIDPQLEHCFNLFFKD